jgi:uncharacterized protein (UPF0548 family)
MVANKKSSAQQAHLIVIRAKRTLASLNAHKRRLVALINEYEHDALVYAELSDEVEQLEEAFLLAGQVNS